MGTIAIMRQLMRTKPYTGNLLYSFWYSSKHFSRMRSLSSLSNSASQRMSDVESLISIKIKIPDRETQTTIQRINIKKLSMLKVFFTAKSFSDSIQVIHGNYLVVLPAVSNRALNCEREEV